MRLSAFLLSAAVAGGVAASAPALASVGSDEGNRPAHTRPVPGHGSARAALDLPRDMPRAVAAARAVRAEYGVPVSVTLGQLYLESGNGRSGLARRWRNYFGIKCGPSGPGPIATGCTPPLGTTEFYGADAVRIADRFRAYASPEASMRDYGRLVTSGRYAGTLAHRRDPAAFLAELARSGYATTPGYAGRVQAVIRHEGFGRYDR